MAENYTEPSGKSDSSKPREDEEVGIRNLKLLYRNPPGRHKSSGASSDEDTTSSSLVPIPDTLRQMRNELKRTISDIGEHSEMESSTQPESCEKVRSSLDELRKIYTLKNESSVAIKMNSANLLLDDILASSPLTPPLGPSLGPPQPPSGDSRNSSFYKEHEARAKSETETVTTETSSSSDNTSNSQQLPPLVTHTVPSVAFAYPPQPTCAPHFNAFQPVCTCSSILEKGDAEKDQMESQRKKSFLEKLQNLQLKHKIMVMYKMMQKTPFAKESNHFQHNNQEECRSSEEEGSENEEPCTCEKDEKQYPKRMIFDLIESSDVSQSEYKVCKHKKHKEKLKKNCTCPIEVKFSSANPHILTCPKSVHDTSLPEAKHSFACPKSIHDMNLPEGKHSFICPKSIHDMGLPEGTFINRHDSGQKECTCPLQPETGFLDQPRPNTPARKKWTVVRRKEKAPLPPKHCISVHPNESCKSVKECTCLYKRESSKSGKGCAGLYQKESGKSIKECTCLPKTESCKTCVSCKSSKSIKECTCLSKSNSCKTCVSCKSSKTSKECTCLHKVLKDGSCLVKCETCSSCKSIKECTCLPKLLKNGSILLKSESCNSCKSIKECTCLSKTLKESSSMLKTESCKSCKSIKECACPSKSESCKECKSIMECNCIPKCESSKSCKSCKSCKSIKDCTCVVGKESCKSCKSMKDCACLAKIESGKSIKEYNPSQKEVSSVNLKECTCPEITPQCICYKCTCKVHQATSTSFPFKKSSELKSLLRPDECGQEVLSLPPSPEERKKEFKDVSEQAIAGSEVHSERKVVEAETVSKTRGGWKKRCMQRKQIFEKTDIYYFDHGNSAYYRTTDRHPTRYTECLVERTDEYATKFWAEIFGVVAIGLSFIVSFVIQFCRFILTSIIRSLTVGLLQIFSDYFFKPLLTIIFNGLIQPCLILVYNMATSVRDLCLPISQIFGFFTKEIAHIFRAFRLVDVNSDSYRQPICDCGNKV